MAIEQPTLDVPRSDRIELEAPTEAELCTRGAVKLTHIELAELRMVNRGLRTELTAERNRNDTLKSLTNSLQTELQVLKASLNPMKYQEIIIRLIELVILALLGYAIDFAKSGDRTNFTVFIVICLVLVVLIFLIQSKPGVKKAT